MLQVVFAQPKVAEVALGPDTVPYPFLKTSSSPGARSTLGRQARPPNPYRGYLFENPGDSILGQLIIREPQDFP